ncbi:universal stress protein [Micrococcus luteus]|uniref:universal stress protein n=1 Tax=Micrococcus luteus TaxID=1270 RepID=UPI0021506049|nr:universal stress protein [Micrococcus luteus]MCR4488025.1 universal stress protein [Micrococcus luteus]MCV7505999.1 universal stress protein [Micrococcus luteus]MCV7519079.1 universal stress protein [Micrococcus luteus]MCV7568469.1 universal stress protein [Micrococcus luteus]
MSDLILVGTDGSPTAARAVREAGRLAAGLGARLLILTAIPSTAQQTISERAHDMPAPRSWRSPGRQEAETVLAEAARSLDGSGVEVETVAQEGDPAEALLSVAERRGVDLIVVGNKGMTGVQRFLLGSVPNKVAHHAPCSVHIVRTS